MINESLMKASRPGKDQGTSTSTGTGTNMWQDILRDSMTKKDLEESHVFLFGDKFSGKRSIVKFINKELLLKGEFEGKFIFYIL
jgi:hypothetical protein